MVANEREKNNNKRREQHRSVRRSARYWRAGLARVLTHCSGGERRARFSFSCARLVGRRDTGWMCVCEGTDAGCLFLDPARGTGCGIFGGSRKRRRMRRDFSEFFWVSHFWIFLERIFWVAIEYFFKFIFD